jgi:small-conductance mechanosensitive channel
LGTFVEALRELLTSDWARDIGMLLAASLVAYAPARWMVGRLKARRRLRADRESHEAQVLRNSLEASVWPILALVLLALAGRAWMAFVPEATGDPTGILPVLGFFLIYRILNELLKDLGARTGGTRRLRRVVIPCIFALAVLQQVDLLGPLLAWLRQPFATVGGVPVSMFSILAGIVVLIAFFLGGRLVGHLLAVRLLPGLGVDAGVGEAMGTVVRYLIVVLGFVVALDTLGFDLTAVKIGFGALGVGIGFGLQNLVNNFTSGLILLFERTVKKGDILTAAGTDGRVMNIGLRSSVMRTRAGDDIIVPNSLLVSDMVTNYSYGDPLKRLDVSVGVSYGSDPRQVEKIMLEVAASNARVLKSPHSTVLFVGFGESSLDFELRVWLDNAWFLPQIRSELLFAIWYRFKEDGVEIPFPQRDLHVRSGTLKVERAQEPSDA